MKRVLNGSQCPTCHVGVKHPIRPDEVLIEARLLEHEGRWWSHCLVCAGLYDARLQRTPQNYDERKGWFEC